MRPMKPQLWDMPMQKSMFDAHPHPGPNLGLAPLPRGEGDVVPVRWNIFGLRFAEIFEYTLIAD